MAQTTPSLDDIIRRVREEAARQPEAASSPVVASVALPHLASEDNPLTVEEGETVALDLLLLEEGDHFLHNAYRVLLGREADPAGLDNYRAVLGHSGKLAVLSALRLSAEGRRRAVQVDGLALPMGLYGLARLLERRGIRVGMGRVLRALERWQGRRLAAVRSLMRRQAAASRQAEARLAGTEARLAVLFDLKAQYLETRQALAAARDEIARLRAEQRGQFQRLDTLLDRLAHNAAEPDVQQLAQRHAHDKIDLYYRAFEDANRGSLEEIRAKQSVYLPRFAALRAAGLQAPVLDIGCGRGEWLLLLQEQGWTVRGVDMNPVMVAACREQGLEAEVGDALACLRRLPDASLGAVTGFHIIEHVPFETLYGLFEEARRVLVPGGMILFETPNPENVLVGSHTFYHDFSHRNPVTPTSVSFLARYHGFERVEVERYNPYPESAKVPGDDPLTERVNGHLCGPQDYALIGYVPEHAA
ncbi:Methyltransferase domain [Gulbenkiania indica]|uniref:Methyltransferase domain n=1 Tax=Gulbenkiania indica TaxID=375574 RepID=A0A0K6GXT6_9NEIS|nr:methyltransferase domain-containing protein [Gulbenkiania indica]CUA83318.1 Methyltransferase domain [Gulbenkiania indica]